MLANFSPCAPLWAPLFWSLIMYSISHVLREIFLCLRPAIQPRCNMRKGKFIHTFIHWWQWLPCKVPTVHQEQFGVRCLAQGYLTCGQGSQGSEPETFSDYWRTCSWATPAREALLSKLFFTRLLNMRRNSAKAVASSWLIIQTTDIYTLY